MSAAAARRRAEAAALLVATRLRDDELFGGLPADLRPPDEDSAYRVQHAAHGLLATAGFGVRCGWKIGCTTKVMQQYLGIGTPCAGALFQANVWRADHVFALPRSGRLGVECEIAVRLATELLPRGAPVGEGQAAAAVASSMAAIEVVADRYVDYGSLDTETLIADDFFQHGCVLGPEREGFSPAALRATTAEMAINGNVVGSGSGADIMGEPLSVLAWLANAAVSWGMPLQPGEVVLLGSLVQTQWVGAGDRVEVRNAQLGQVATSFRRLVDSPSRAH